VIRVDIEVSQEKLAPFQAFQKIIQKSLNKGFFSTRPDWKIYYKIVTDMVYLIEELLKKKPLTKENLFILKELIVGEKGKKKYGLVRFALFHKLRLQKDNNWRIREAAFKGLIKIWDLVIDREIRA